MKINIPKANCDLINSYEKPWKSTGGFSSHALPILLIVCLPAFILLLIGGAIMTIFSIEGTNQ
jgi:hypothetical protein|tara:strand:- start:4644 stop:4832 length:189 start_codon:yes stop_codon:yes gene_type:complete